MDRLNNLRDRKAAIERELIGGNQAFIGTGEFDHEAWLAAEHEELKDEMERTRGLEGLSGGVGYE